MRVNCREPNKAYLPETGTYFKMSEQPERRRKRQASYMREKRARHKEQGMVAVLVYLNQDQIARLDAYVTAAGVNGRAAGIVTLVEQLPLSQGT